MVGDVIAFRRTASVAFVLQNKYIDRIDDLENLGLYTYVCMLLEDKDYTLEELSDQVVKRFGTEENYTYALLEMLEELDLI